MKTSYIHIERNFFIEEVVNLVNDYLDNMEVYSEDSCIAVQKHTYALELLTPAEAGPDWEIYPIDSFFHQNENKEGMEGDVIATFDLADKYYVIK